MRRRSSTGRAEPEREELPRDRLEIVASRLARAARCRRRGPQPRPVRRVLSRRGMDAGTRALGIASALTLVATLCWQLRAQWKKGTSEGVSRFLFIGQLGASTGFAIY